MESSEPPKNFNPCWDGNNYVLIEILENLIPLWLKKIKPPVTDNFTSEIVQIIKKGLKSSITEIKIKAYNAWQNLTCLFNTHELIEKKLELLTKPLSRKSLDKISFSHKLKNHELIVSIVASCWPLVNTLGPQLLKQHFVKKIIVPYINLCTCGFEPTTLLEKSVSRRMRGTYELELVKIACEIFAHISLAKDKFPPKFNFTLSTLQQPIMSENGDNLTCDVVELIIKPFLTVFQLASKWTIEHADAMECLWEVMITKICKDEKLCEAHFTVAFKTAINIIQNEPSLKSDFVFKLLEPFKNCPENVLNSVKYSFSGEINLNPNCTPLKYLLQQFLSQKITENCQSFGNRLEESVSKLIDVGFKSNLVNTLRFTMDIIKENKSSILLFIWLQISKKILICLRTDKKCFEVEETENMVSLFTEVLQLPYKFARKASIFDQVIEDFRSSYKHLCGEVMEHLSWLNGFDLLEFQTTLLYALVDKRCSITNYRASKPVKFLAVFYIEIFQRVNWNDLKKLDDKKYIELLKHFFKSLVASENLNAEDIDIEMNCFIMLLSENIISIIDLAVDFKGTMIKAYKNESVTCAEAINKLKSKFDFEKLNEVTESQPIKIEKCLQDSGVNDDPSLIVKTPGGTKKRRSHKRRSLPAICSSNMLKRSSHIAISKTNNVLINNSRKIKSKKNFSQNIQDDSQDYFNNSSSSDESKSLIEFLNITKNVSGIKSPTKTSETTDIHSIDIQQTATNSNTIEFSDFVKSEINERTAEETEEPQILLLDSSNETSPESADKSVKNGSDVKSSEADVQSEEVCSNDASFEKQLQFIDQVNNTKDDSKLSLEDKSLLLEDKSFDVQSNHVSGNKELDKLSSNVNNSKQKNSSVITNNCSFKSNLEHSFITPKVESKDNSYLSSFSVNNSTPSLSLKSIMDEKIPYSMYSSNSESKLEAWATPDNSTIQVENGMLTKDDTRLETSVKTSTPIPAKLKENMSIEKSVFEGKSDDLNGTKEVEKLHISDIPALNGNISPTHIGIPIRQAISLTYPKKGLLKRTNLFPSESPMSKRAKVHFNEEYNHCQEYKRDVNTPMRPTHTAFIRKRNSPKRPNPTTVNRELKFNTRAEKWLKKDMTSPHSLQLREFNRLMSHSRELKEKIARHASSTSSQSGKNYFDGLTSRELSDVLVAMHPTCQVVRALAKKLKAVKPE